MFQQPCRQEESSSWSHLRRVFGFFSQCAPSHSEVDNSLFFLLFFCLFYFTFLMVIVSSIINFKSFALISTHLLSIWDRFNLSVFLFSCMQISMFFFSLCQNVQFAPFVYFHKKNHVFAANRLLLIFFDFLCAYWHRWIPTKLQSVLIHIFKIVFAITKNNNNNKYK